MSSFWGMHTEQVRAHGERLRAAAGDVSALRSRLDGIIGSVDWQGPDAETFRTRWEDLASGRLTDLREELEASAGQMLGEADQQDVASDRHGMETGPGRNPSTLPDAPHGDLSQGYRQEDNPWLPNWLENPLEGAVSGLAAQTSELLGWGFNGAVDLLEGGLGLFGVKTDGIGQFQNDANHLGGILEDWATGERVPTIAEMGAAGIVAAGSAGVGFYEAVTGNDTAFLDDRPGGIVHGVETTSGPQQSPADLGDLIIGNNSLRMPNPGGPLENGQIGIQEIHNSTGSEPVFIVQVPPTEGAGLGEFPEAYGGQGNSRDWGSNLRLVSGQHPAAMDDVRAAMEAAGVPPGANVMLVGHSQGGIVATHLAADASFNNDSGAPGTYNVTHGFTVGSPVQTVLPAQDSTEVVNVTHGPVGLDPQLEFGGVPVPLPTDISYTGDPIAQLDLQGLQIDGGTLSAPNLHEVVLPGSSGQLSQGTQPLFDNHDSYSADDPSFGYYGSVQEASSTDPVLTALQNDLTGVYLGDGTYVAESHVVTVGRGDP